MILQPSNRSQSDYYFTHNKKLPYEYSRKVVFYKVDGKKRTENRKFTTIAHKTNRTYTNMNNNRK